MKNLKFLFSFCILALLSITMAEGHATYTVENNNADQVNQDGMNYSVEMPCAVDALNFVMYFRTVEPTVEVGWQAISTMTSMAFDDEVSVSNEANGQSITAISEQANTSSWQANVGYYFNNANLTSKDELGTALMLKAWVPNVGYFSNTALNVGNRTDQTAAMYQNDRQENIGYHVSLNSINLNLEDAYTKSEQNLAWAKSPEEKGNFNVSGYFLKNTMKNSTSVNLPEIVAMHCSTANKMASPNLQQEMAFQENIGYISEMSILSQEGSSMSSFSLTG